MVGPAISELLKQFIAHNRMMTGGFSIHGDLVTLSDINCPVLAVVGEVDDIGQPASVRGIKRAAPQADVYEFSSAQGISALVVGSKAATQTWPTVAQWVKWIDGTDDLPDGVADGAAARRARRKRCPFTSRVAHHRRRDRDGVQPGTNRRRRGRRRQQVRAALAVETYRTLPRLARLGQINDHTRISLGRIMSEQARDAPRASACCSTAASTPTKRWTAGSTTWSAA